MIITKNTKFIIAVAVQLLIIVSIIIFKLAVLTGGTEVLLRIEPVDPRDPLRGDYVVFQYSISNINQWNLSNVSVGEGDTVYVSLRQGGKYWNDSNVSKDKPGDGQLFIKGVVTQGNIVNGNVADARDVVAGEFIPTVPTRQQNRTEIRVKYGIEEYFIPEGTGQTFRFWDHEASAYVAIDANGNAVLKQIYIDDSPWP